LIDSLYSSVSPHFVLRPVDTVLPEDSTAVFQCDAMGQPTPLISWYKNSKYYLYTPTSKVLPRRLF